MFDKEFYPTPEDVIHTMIADCDLQNKYVLEPSAGKGDIVDVLKQYGAKVLACELDFDLAKIVSTKCDLIDRDFLSLKSDRISHCDFIIMNPPFKNADKHILHAFNIAPEGCEIIALCNYETINNRYTRMRSRLYNVISENGSYINLGQCFSDAERTTDVEVGLIKLYKPKNGDDEFEDFMFSDEEEASIFGGSGVAQYSKIRDVVSRYIQGVKMFDSVMDKADEINECIKPLGGNFNIKFNAKNYTGSDYTKITRDSFKKELQKSAWISIFNDLNMDKYVTKSVKDNLNKFVEQQSTKPFTMKNVFSMIEVIVGTHEDRMYKVIEETFDWLTKHHHENRHSLAGWKTNSMYMVNKKFIAPYCGVDLSSNGHPEIIYGSIGSESFDDLIKAICVIVGERYEDKTSLYEFFRPKKEKEGYTYKEFGKWYDWNFFEIKVFKKGTLHAKFKDEKVWEMFNKAAVKTKGWRLPTKTGSDMNNKSNSVDLFNNE